MEKDKMIEEIKRKFEDPEFLESTRKYFLDIEIKRDMELDQIDRFHLKYQNKEDFDKIVNKIIDKYSSNKYKDRWYSRGIEPPESLYYFIFEYSGIYGENLSKKEYKKYTSPFCSAAYKIHDYIFELMIGQGSAIRIIKI